MWPATMKSAILYKYKGVVFPTLGFPLFYRPHYRRTPLFILDVHIDVFHSTKRLHTLHFSHQRLIYRSVKTQRKLKTSSSPPPLHTRYNQKRPRPSRRTPEMDPSSTEPGKRADWTIVFLAPFPPPAPPPSVANKMDGLPSFFRMDRERFLLL